MATVQQVLDTARGYLGMIQGSSRHHRLIDAYNKITPRPVGYIVTYADDWCDAFVTVVGDQAGASDLIGRECGVQRHIHLFTAKGIWLGRVKPVAGDIICFDWDGGGFADHIGFVESVSGNTVTTIEGNSARSVARRQYAYNDWRIKGYARPKYRIGQTVGPDKIRQLAKEVLDGLWGNGQDRIRRLQGAGYPAGSVQAAVNDLVAKRDQANYPARVTVAQHATHWQTGQPIDDWVKGKTFAVAEVKAINQSKSKQAYLLVNRGLAIGWLLDQDVQK
ncbi:hypothetical protein AWM75_07885 [Aerococcus urinaehominis]|uniref:Uncharacterized protein n=1 Tax=Aerococcus urinaehominis TaxID=128944 RepID=A0A0X8FNG6_9LACT|nr:CHAP domain-containing protein [Aerococcus urinaehominis]AMB99892.1 hypothetical protein AWM75_07885 [Aerococcus urinaehominis]SDM52829.1 CHAP domain-containing protein [Aerococcus urinaehominis]